MSTWDEAQALVRSGQIPIRIAPHGEGFRATVAIPFADGRVMLVRAFCSMQQAADAIGFRGLDALAANVGDVLQDKALCMVERAIPVEGVGGIGAVPLDAAEFFWRAIDAAKLKKKVTDVAAKNAWWKGLGVKQRQRSRATFKAIRAAAPKNLSERQQLEWWGRAGKDKRKSLREKHGNYGGGPLKDIGKVLESVADPLSDAAQLIPVVGPLVSAQVKALLGAGVLTDPKKLGLMALAGPGTMAYLGTTKKGSLVPQAKEIGKQLRTVAGSQAGKQALLKAGEVLGRPEVLAQMNKLQGSRLGEQLSAALTASRIVDRARKSAPGSAKQLQALAAARKALKAAGPKSATKKSVQAPAALPAARARDVRRYVVELSRA